MSSVSAPFGLRLADQSTGGIIRPKTLENAIPSGYANSIYEGQPVKGVTAGQIQEVSGTTDEYLGPLASVTYQATGQRPTIGNFWPGGTTLDAATPLVAAYYQDPWLEYEIQADGSVAQTAVFGGTNFSNLTAGSTLTGLSQCTASATIAGSGTAQMRVVGKNLQPTNDWGDAFTVLRVLNSLSQLAGNKAVI